MSIRFLFVSLVLIACFSSVRGQTRLLDSLHLVLDTTKNEKVQVEVLNALAFELCYIQADSAILLAKKALAIADRLRVEKGQADAYNNLGVANHIRGNFTEALFNYQQSKELRMALKDSAGVAGLLNNMGSIFAVRGNYPLALESYQASLNLKIKLGNERGAANSLNNIGNIYYYQKNYDQSSKYYQEALAIEMKIENKLGQGRSLGNIGLVLLDQGKFSEATVYYRKAYRIMDSLDLECQTMYPANGLGACLLQVGQVNEAKDYLNEALQQAKDCGDPVIISSALESLGKVELLLNNDSKGERFFLESYEEALSNDLKASIKDVSWSLYQFYKSKNTKRALEFLEINKMASDSLFNQDLTEQLTRLELNYQFQQEKDSLQFARERDILAFNGEIKRKQVIQISTFVGLGFACILIFIIYRFYQLKTKANNQLSDKNTIISKALKEKELMLNEIHHRVKNNLQIVSSLLNIQSRMIKDKNAKRAIQDSQNRILSMAMVHQNLYSQGEVSEIWMDVYLNQIIDSISEALDQEETYKLETSFERISLPPDMAMNIGLIANELLTNVYKHAFPKGEKTDAKITIVLGQSERELLFSVKDNGVGKSNKKESYGTYLMQTLANSMNAELTFKVEEGTSYYLKIPIADEL